MRGATVAELINDKNAEILDLKAQNIRLQSELDRYIKMASDYEKALKIYDDAVFIRGKENKLPNISGNLVSLAQEILKKWE